ncbi:hypothetical protein MROS_1536 [Melioribacter roseus P3M-2]|uniref:Secretion system C-terminal sorting domain-containing protein n=2 Tax=Melioribacter TaxID=1134403 RepID=I7A0I9_MELRP|nr:T9SS type A sorting domain-containing protein [Melioribacter roseus]AFN74773.1 hypothetical protein MROS_1536 [Melioribacter roseus P3M-2]
MKSIYLTILFVFLTSIMFAQYDDPYQFFPANLGDHWEYTRAGGDLHYTVLRDSIDPKDSSRFIFFYDPPLYYGANYRIDRNYNVFNVPQFDNRHLYKLNAQVGERWVVIVEDSSKWEESMVSGIYEGYVFGKRTLIKEIQHFQLWIRPDSLIDTTFLDVEKLAYGFGRISRENYVLQPLLLRGCRINGVTYGIVDVKDEATPIPSGFVLFQNYPNPFNPSTIIRYKVSAAGKITLKVYDMLGREIITLVNEEKQPGIYEVKFDGTGLPTGIYFYQMITNEAIQTKKMILQK